MGKIEIFNEVSSFRVPRKRIVEAFGAFLKHERVKTMFVSLIFVGEAKMKDLNETWKKGKGSTDVLSFNYGEGVGVKGGTTGEIYICVKVANRNASSDGVRLYDEILHLFVHGLLHIRGYTHENESKMNEMNRKVFEILELTFSPV